MTQLAAPTYRVEYRDRRGRWHTARGRYTFAADALTAAYAYEQWRVLDAENNVIASGDSLLDTQ